MEIILRENGGIHQKQHKVQFSIHVSVVQVQEGLTSFDFISKETLSTFPFSRMGLGFASALLVARFIFIFSLCKFFNSLAQGPSGGLAGGPGGSWPPQQTF